MIFEKENLIALGVAFIGNKSLKGVHWFFISNKDDNLRKEILNVYNTKDEKNNSVINVIPLVDRSIVIIDKKEWETDISDLMEKLYHEDEKLLRLNNKLDFDEIKKNEISNLRKYIKENKGNSTLDICLYKTSGERSKLVLSLDENKNEITSLLFGFYLTEEDLKSIHEIKSFEQKELIDYDMGVRYTIEV